MNPDAPTAYAPPVDTHGSLINLLHRAIVNHPHPQQKADYAKMFAQALAMQARSHTAAQTPGAAGGAPAGNPSGGAGVSPGAEATPPPLGYIDQNVTPLQAALTAAGGTEALIPRALHHPLGVRPGSLAALLSGGLPDLSAIL